MVGHNDEGVKPEFASVAIAEECGDEEFGSCGALEESAALVSYSREGIGLGFEAHGGGRVPGAKAPCFSVAGDARTEVRAYLRSKCNDRRKCTPWLWFCGWR